MNSDIFLFAGGGTGGHLYPGLAVAEELRAILPAAKVVFACSRRAIDRRVLDPTPYAVVPQPVLPMPRGPRGWWAFLRAWGASVRQARDLVRDLRPAAVLGLGGFAAGPLVRQAARAGVPAALLNPDAVPGMANRVLAGCAQAIFTQFDSTAECFPASVRARVSAVGCPVRRGLSGGRRDEAVRHFGLREDRRTLLVFGASLGAASINEAVAALAADLAALAGSWQILHVTGPQKGAGLREAYERAGVPVCLAEYCERMDLAYAAADVALCRSGAGTVAELAITGTPAVLMPYPYHRDRQQALNAESLARAGGAVVCEDAREPAANAARLRETLLPLLREPQRLEEMRRAALSSARPEGARKVARWLAERCGRPEK